MWLWILSLALWHLVPVSSLAFRRGHSQRGGGGASGKLHAATTASAGDDAFPTSLPYDATELREFDGAPDPNPLLEAIPSRVQRYLRDAGILRFSVDALARTVAAPAFYREHPHCFPEFIRISEYPHWLSRATSRVMGKLWNVTDPHASNAALDHVAEGDCADKPRVAFHKERYGAHPLQKADVMVNESLCGQGKDARVPLFIFLHGGAWGSGFPTMYRLIAAPFLARNYRAVVMGYRTHPDGTMEDQVQDLVEAVEHFAGKYATGPAARSGPDAGPNDGLPGVVVVGHSSGAHVALLAAATGRLPARVDALVGLSGVYDLELVRARERRLGLVGISPVDPTSGERLRENSPAWLAARAGHAAAGRKEARPLPPLLLLHGDDDTVALPAQSKVLRRILLETETRGRRAALPETRCRLEIIQGAQHQDTVIQTCLGCGRTQAAIFEWLDDLKREHSFQFM